jgi:general secretion pathway protein L
MSRKIIAIDIRSNTLAAVVLNSGLKSSAVQAGIVIPIDREKKNDDGLASALDTLFRQIDSTGATIVVALPGADAFYRTVRIPFKDEKKIRQVLPFELEPTLPVNVDALVIDFRKGREDDHTEVLATAIDRELLQHYLDLFNALNKHPQLVVPGPLPLVTYLLSPASQLPEQCLLLDADHTKIMLFAINDGTIALVRALSSANGNESAVETLALQVRQTLTAYSDANGISFSPSVVYLNGPAMRDNSRHEVLAKALDLPVEPIDLMSRAQKVEPAANLENWNPWFMDNSLALALLEAEGRPCPNFHRTGSPLRDYWNAYRSYIKGPAILLGIVLLLGLGGVLVENHLLQQRVDQLDEAITGTFKSAFPEITRIVDPVIQMRNQIDSLKKNAIDPNDSGIHVRSIDILNEISRLIPKEVDVRFSRMVLGGDTITVSGDTAAFNVVDDVKTRLEESELFKSVTIASANMDKASTQVSFKLKIDL